MSVLLRRVTLHNYKSIGQCKVDLSGLNVLVGPNGSGKSNFIDALRLVSESLSETLDYAIRQRGGIAEVRRRSGGHPSHFAISLRLRLDESANASYAFRIGALSQGAFRVQHEQAHISGDGFESAYYDVQDGELQKLSTQLRAPPKILEDRLYLSAVSGAPAFRPLFDALSQMGFYNINPADIRELQLHDRGTILSRSGRNLSSVVKRLRDESPQSIERIEDYLRQIVPGIDGVEHRQLGPRETLEFRQDVQGQKHPWRFYAAAMSDGTLRSLGVLTALFQFAGSKRGTVPLVAIEEPESTVHPAAAADDHGRHSRSVEEGTSHRNHAQSGPARSWEAGSPTIDRRHENGGRNNVGAGRCCLHLGHQGRPLHARRALEAESTASGFGNSRQAIAPVWFV